MTSRSNAPRVTHVRTEADGVHLAWDDGHGSHFRHRYLRGNCPCAICVVEGTNQRVVFEKDVPEDVYAVDWIQVGQYGVQMLWSDTHMTGIYTFDYLRHLCPCPQHGGEVGQEAREG